MKLRTLSRLFLLLFVLSVTLPACRAKYGCKINEETHTNLKKTKGKAKQNLFPKKMRRN